MPVWIILSLQKSWIMLRLALIGIVVCLGIPLVYSQATTTEYFRSNEDPFVNTLPFRLAGNVIILQAAVDDRLGNFLVDSGSPYLIINERYAKNKSSEVTDYCSNDLTGQSNGLKKATVHFRLGNIVKRNQPVFLMDLSPLEKNKGIEILGVIGHHFLKSYEVLIDYQERILILFALDGRGERKSKTTVYAPPDQTIPMEKTRHLLYLEASVGAHGLKLGIDCGAEMSILDKKSAKKIEAYYRPSHAVKVVTFSKDKTIASVGRIERLRIAGKDLQLSGVVLTNLDAINQHLITELDGFLGYGFLSRYRIALNYRKQTLSLWQPAWPLAAIEERK